MPLDPAGQSPAPAFLSRSFAALSHSLQGLPPGFAWTAELCPERSKTYQAGRFPHSRLGGSPPKNRSGPARNPPGPALDPPSAWDLLWSYTQLWALHRTPDSVRTCWALPRPAASSRLPLLPARRGRAAPSSLPTVALAPGRGLLSPSTPCRARALPGTLGPDRPRAQSVAISRLGVPPKNLTRASPGPARGFGSPSTPYSHRALPGTRPG